MGGAKWFSTALGRIDVGVCYNIRVVLGLGDGAGGWEGGGVGSEVGGNCSSGMDRSKKITKKYPGRGKCI